MKKIVFSVLFSYMFFSEFMDFFNFCISLMKVFLLINNFESNKHSSFETCKFVVRQIHAPIMFAQL